MTYLGSVSQMVHPSKCVEAACEDSTGGREKMWLMQGNEEGLGKKPPVPSSSNQELRCGASFKEFSLYLKGNEKS